MPLQQEANMDWEELPYFPVQESLTTGSGQQTHAAAGQAMLGLPAHSVVVSTSKHRDVLQMRVRKEMCISLRALGDRPDIVTQLRAINDVSKPVFLRREHVSVGPSRTQMGVHNLEKNCGYYITIAITVTRDDGGQGCSRCGAAWDFTNDCLCDPACTIPSVEPASVHTRIGANRWKHVQHDDWRSPNVTWHFRFNPGSVRPGIVFISVLLEVHDYSSGGYWWDCPVLAAMELLPK